MNTKRPQNKKTLKSVYKQPIKHRKSVYQWLLSSFVFLSFFYIALMVLTTPIAQHKTQEIVISKEQKLNFFDTIQVVAKQNQKQYGVFASITLAQAALESNFGTSQLATKYYNLFGVKGNAKNGVLLPTLEYYNGAYQTITDYFVIYSNWDESIRAHGQLLSNGTSWNKNQYKDVLIAKNYQDAARGLVTGGYATDPHYAEKIIQMIEIYRLYTYDK